MSPAWQMGSLPLSHLGSPIWHSKRLCITELISLRGKISISPFEDAQEIMLFPNMLNHSVPL